MTTLGFKIVLLGLISVAAAQSAHADGVIRGVIRDSLSGDPLVGANVFLVGTSRGAAANVDGEYRVEGVPPGDYTLRVTFLGFNARQVEVTVEDDETTVVDVNLMPDVIEGAEVVITAQAAGQAAAINQQLTSNTIMNVVSEEKIQELPDANAAEAVGRLPGVSIQRSGGEANKVVLRGLSDKYTSITIDGVRIAATDADARGVDLSTISQGSLAGIELFKAITPDKDGDAIAGSINFVTRKAPEYRLIRLDARGGYGGLNSSIDQYDVNFRFGDRLLRDLLGVQVSGNLERRDRSKEDINLDYNLRDIDDGRNYEITDIALNFTDELRTRGGASVIFDVNTPDGGSVKLSNVFNTTTRNFVEYNRNYPTDSDPLLYGARDREQRITTFNSALTGDNHFAGLSATWGASFATSNSDYPFDFDIGFVEPASLDENQQPASRMRNIPNDKMKGPAEDIIPYAINNFERAYFYTAYFRGEESRDRELTSFLNLSRNYSLGDLFSGEMKVGGKFRQKDRSRERSELLAPYYNEQFPRFVQNGDGSITAKDFSGTQFDELSMVGSRLLVTNFLSDTDVERDIFGLYRLYPMVDRDALREWWQLNQRGFSDAGGTNPEYERNLEADALFYEVTERISAGYVMNTFNVGRFATLIAGVRVEHENNDYLSRYSPRDLSGFPVPAGVIRDTTASHAETVWLPNAHLNLRPTDFLNVRMAAYKALARPDFNHRLATVVARKAGTFYPGNSLYIGNPDLRAAQAWNYEVNASVYGSRVGLLSVSAYYKDIEEMYHVLNGLPFNGQQALDSLGINYTNPFSTQEFALTYPYNSTRPTRVWGLEFEHQTNFRYLPGLLRNILLSYNLSLARSETFVPATRLETYLVDVPGIPFPVERTRYILEENEQKLQGQPELFGNASIGYDTWRFSARISVFHQGDYNLTFSPDGRSDDTVDGFTRWDVALRSNISSSVSVMLNLNNITNAREGSTIVNRVQGWNLLNTRETFGFTADLGLRVTL